jgi:cell division protein FtsN
MAQRKKRRRKKAPQSQAYPGWLWMLFGLAIGLSVAFAVYVKDRRPDPQPVAAQPASLQNALDDNGETSPAGSAGAETPPAEEKKEKRFTFYDVLPAFEMIVPDAPAESPEAGSNVEPQAIVEPGLYVLQAGSFSTHTDADRRRAELALHGIESHIQRVMVNDRDYFRVYVGPTDELDELNMLRSRLRAAQIDVLRIRLGD